MSEIQDPITTEKQKYQNIGGWLILVGIGIVLSPLRLLLFIGRDLLPVFLSETWTTLTTPGTQIYHPFWGPLLIFELLGNVFFLVFSLVLVIFFFQKRKALPTMIITFYLLNLFFVVSDHFLANLIPLIANQSDQGSLLEIFRSAIASLIWVPYFLFSKRVKGTFVN